MSTFLRERISRLPHAAINARLHRKSFALACAINQDTYIGESQQWYVRMMICVGDQPHASGLFSEPLQAMDFLLPVTVAA
jgi:hypothetical protein